MRSRQGYLACDGLPTTMADGVFRTTITDGVLQAGRPDTDWLSTGVDGGRQRADAAYNITVPTEWDDTDLSEYVDRRTAAAGFEIDGPALLTGVKQRHARRAILNPVEALVTAGLSNPATLPPQGAVESSTTATADRTTPDATDHYGTINIIVGTTRALPPAALASLLAGVAEAKTATLSHRTDFSGTTSDAVVVGSDPTGAPAQFAGSATTVGQAARACVRDALTAAVDARYPDGDLPGSVAAADYGTATMATAAVSTPR